MIVVYPLPKIFASANIVWYLLFFMKCSYNVDPRNLRNY